MKMYMNSLDGKVYSRQFLLFIVLHDTSNTWNTVESRSSMKAPNNIINGPSTFENSCYLLLINVISYYLSINVIIGTENETIKPTGNIAFRLKQSRGVLLPEAANQSFACHHVQVIVLYL